LACDWVFAPMGIDELSFRPCRASSNLEIEPRDPQNPQVSFVATEHCSWRNRLLAGEVHDENAFCLGGVAAHAGLFGTARGIFCFLAFLWRISRGHMTVTGWSPSVIETFFTRDDSVPGSTWALGFDTPSPGCSTSGDYLSTRSIGHLGFTGTSFWMDLHREVIMVLLTNRVYPTRENQGLKLFRPLIHNLAMEAFHELYRPN
jgi:serine-type D-Ala-D-Ala carboxypeptidase